MSFMQGYPIYQNFGQNLSATLPRGGIAPTFRPNMASAHPPVVQRAGPPSMPGMPGMPAAIPTPAKPSKISKADESVSMITYYEVRDMDTFANLTVEMAETKKAEPTVLACSFSFNGNQVMCKESFESADSAKVHLDATGPMAKRAAESADIIKVEVMGPEEQLEKLRESFNDVNVMFWATADTAFLKAEPAPAAPVYAAPVRAQPVYGAPMYGTPMGYGGQIFGQNSLSFVPLPYKS
jgi:hypothetical protein